MRSEPIGDIDTPERVRLEPRIRGVCPRRVDDLVADTGEEPALLVLQVRFVERTQSVAGERRIGGEVVRVHERRRPGEGGALKGRRTRVVTAVERVRIEVRNTDRETAPGEAVIEVQTGSEVRGLLIQLIRGAREAARVLTREVVGAKVSANGEGVRRCCCLGSRG